MNSYQLIIEKFNNKLPTIDEFAFENQYDITRDTFSRFWNNFDENIPILIDDELISWMGYNADKSKKNKQNLIKLLDNHNIPYNTYSYKDYINLIKNEPEYSTFEVPENNKSTVKNTFITMNVYDFKEASMMVNTERGCQIRRYYIKLEKLFNEYKKLQNYYKENQMLIERTRLENLLIETNNKLENLSIENKETNKKLSNLEKQNDNIIKKLDVATEERSLKPKIDSLWHKLIIVDLKNITTGNYKKYDYYAIRAQRRSARREYNKKFGTYPILYETEYYEGNSINLYNRIKDNFKDKAKFNLNFINIYSEKTNYDNFEDELIDYINSIKEDYNIDEE